MDSFINNNQRVDWPTEPGYYWFYGYRYGKFDGNACAKPELVLCKVSKIVNGIMVTGDGQFFFESEAEQANFIPATLPELMEID